MPDAPTHGGRRAPDGRPPPPAGPGKQPNRSDLSAILPAGAPAQGVYTPTGMPFGDASRLQDAQRIAPAPNNRAPASAPAGAPGAAPAGGSSQASSAGAPPGLFEILTRPTERPDEPVQAGLSPFDPAGTYPGGYAPMTPTSLADTLDAIVGASDGSPDARALADLARQMGL